MIIEMLPTPFFFSTRTDQSRASGATPTMPTPFWRAPMMPADNGSVACRVARGIELVAGAIDSAGDLEVGMRAVDPGVQHGHVHRGRGVDWASRSGARSPLS